MQAVKLSTFSLFVNKVAAGMRVWGVEEVADLHFRQRLKTPPTPCLNLMNLLKL